MYSTLCTITANTSQIARLPTALRNENGRSYYQVEIDVVLLFGLTELKAQIAWKEDVRVVLIPGSIELTSLLQGKEMR